MKTLHSWPEIVHWLKCGGEEVCEFDKIRRLNRPRRSTSRAEKTHQRKFNRAFPWPVRG